VAKNQKPVTKPARRWLLGSTLVAVGLAVAGYFFWRAEERQTVAEASIPAQPVLSDKPPALVQRVRACEQRIKAGSDVIGALAELSQLYHANGLYAEAGQCYQGLLRIDSSDGPHDSTIDGKVMAMKLSGIDANLRSGALKAVAITAASYTTGQSISWTQGRGIPRWERAHRISVDTKLSVRHVMASAALPMFFPAVEIDGQWFGDGGMRLTSPLSPAVHMGADRILAISTRYARSSHPRVDRPDVIFCALVDSSARGSPL